MKNIGDIVIVKVETDFGQISVNFVIIDIISKANEIYLGYAKYNIAKIQFKADNEWYLLRKINISNLPLT